MKFPTVFGIWTLALWSCGDDLASNPPVLYLAPDMVETRVKLVDHEPPPF